MHSLHDYFYELPESLIAQTPCEQRDGCRLLVLDRKTGSVSHKHFYDVIDYLNEGDALVINDSRVIPARIFGVKVRGQDDGNAPSSVECLLLRQRELDTWECIVRPGKRVKTGAVIDFSGVMTGTVLSVEEDGNRIIRFDYDRSDGQTVYSVLERIGRMPLPPYITETLDDDSKYQTVYANELGSAAAPTAGLHFTNELLKKIEDKGIDVVRVMLHVGLGTFRPVKVENIEEHRMHSEFFTVTEDAAARINAARKRGGRIVAVNDTEFESIKQYISENLVGQFATRRRRHAADDAPAGQEQAAPPPPRGGETLVQAVTRLTSELELDDKELCRRANISGSLLGKIRSDGRFRLTRSEVIGLASAFDLDCEGAGQLLQLAGLPPFSMSDRADVILRYLFENDCCDILTINRALFSFDAL